MSRGSGNYDAGASARVLITQAPDGRPAHKQEIIVHYDPEQTVGPDLSKCLAAEVSTFTAYREILSGPGYISGEVSGETLAEIIQKLDRLRSVDGVEQVALAGTMRPQ